MDADDLNRLARFLDEYQTVRGIGGMGRSDLETAMLSIEEKRTHAKWSVAHGVANGGKSALVMQTVMDSGADFFDAAADEELFFLRLFESGKEGHDKGVGGSIDLVEEFLVYVDEIVVVEFGDAFHVVVERIGGASECDQTFDGAAGCLDKLVGLAVVLGLGGFLGEEFANFSECGGVLLVSGLYLLNPFCIPRDESAFAITEGLGDRLTGWRGIERSEQGNEAAITELVEILRNGLHDDAFDGDLDKRRNENAVCPSTKAPSRSEITWVSFFRARKNRALI
jgi:hypothetical protein